MLPLLAGPAMAADGPRALNIIRAWHASIIEPCGRACPPQGGPRLAVGIDDALRQNRAGWLNTADADVFRSRLIEPRGGIATIRGAVKDGQDEGGFRVTVRDFMGGKIWSANYPRIGNKANGRVVRWSLDAADYGRDGWRGVTVTYRISSDREKGETHHRNGMSFKHRTTPSCPPKASAAAKSSKGGKSGKGRK
jgi:hypothetical protein